MRASVALAIALGPTQLGCFSLPAYNRCENGPALTTPYGFEVYEERQAESAAPFEGRAPDMRVSRGLFDGDRWAEQVKSLPERELPLLGDDLLVCDFQTVRVAGIDAIDTPSGPIATSSTPDLMVWASFAGTVHRRGPRPSTTRATFAFRAKLQKDDSIVFTFGDHDFFSDNDLLARIHGKYPGRVPFSIKEKASSASCHAISASRLESEARARRSEVEALLLAYERYVPTLEEPLPLELRRRVSAQLDALEFFAGSSKTDADTASSRMQVASQKQWQRYVELLADKRAELPPAGSWVAFGELAEVRVSGLRCQVGDQILKRCEPQIDVKLSTDPDTAQCTDGSHDPMSHPIDKLGKIELIESDGSTASAPVWEVISGKRWLRTTAELWRLKKGDVVRLPLRTNSLHESHTGWPVPLIRIGTTYLRVD